MIAVVYWAGVAIAAACTFVVAAWLHELTHAATVWVVNGEIIDINLKDLYVDFRAPSRVAETLVLVSPGLVGVCLLPVLLVNWSGQITPVAVIVGIAWSIYTLTGGSAGELSVLGTKSNQQDSNTTA